MANEHRTRLQEMRRFYGKSQKEMCELTGLSERNYRRLETGEISDPSIRMLTNCAMALGVPLWDILEPEWVRWTQLGNGPATPPPPAPGEQPREHALSDG